MPVNKISAFLAMKGCKKLGSESLLLKISNDLKVCSPSFSQSTEDLILFLPQGLCTDSFLAWKILPFLVYFYLAFIYQLQC